MQPARYGLSGSISPSTSNTAPGMTYYVPDVLDKSNVEDIADAQVVGATYEGPKPLQSFSTALLPGVRLPPKILTLQDIEAMRQGKHGHGHNHHHQGQQNQRHHLPSQHQLPPQPSRPYHQQQQQQQQSYQHHSYQSPYQRQQQPNYNINNRYNQSHRSNQYNANHQGYPPSYGQQSMRPQSSYGQQPMYPTQFGRQPYPQQQQHQQQPYPPQNGYAPYPPQQYPPSSHLPPYQQPSHSRPRGNARPRGQYDNAQTHYTNSDESILNRYQSRHPR